MGIAPLAIGIFVLRESRLLKGNIGGVVTDHMGDHQRIGESVGDVASAAQLVGDRVTQAYKGKSCHSDRTLQEL